jgi:hypothetical protein
MSRLSPIDKWIMVFLILLFGTLYFGAMTVLKSREVARQDAVIERMVLERMTLLNTIKRTIAQRESLIDAQVDAIDKLDTLTGGKTKTIEDIKAGN